MEQENISQEQRIGRIEERESKGEKERDRERERERGDSAGERMSKSCESQGGRGRERERERGRERERERERERQECLPTHQLKPTITFNLTHSCVLNSDTSWFSSGVLHCTSCDGHWV